MFSGSPLHCSLVTNQQFVGEINRRAFLATGAAIVGTSLTGCLGRGFGRSDDAGVLEERSFPAPSVDSIRVKNMIGDVTIAAVGSGDVGVSVLKRSGRGRIDPDDIDVSIALDGGALSVVTSVDDGASWLSSDSALSDVRIIVPAGDSGPTIRSVDSEIGDVTLMDTHGDTVARTRIGDVIATGVVGYLSLNSELGEVMAANVSGLDSAYTELGNIKVDLLSLRQDVDIGTTFGDIVVGVSEHLDFDLSVETAANIDSNLTLTGQQMLGGTLTGRQNDGGNHVRVTSDLGEVSLRAMPS